MSYQSLIIGLLCYALIGVGVATFGPVRRSLNAAVADLRVAPDDDDSDTRPASSTTVLLFRVVLSLAIVLLWGRYLVFALKSHREDKVIRARAQTEPRVAAERQHGIPQKAGHRRLAREDS
jgi:hypothetical protein